MKIHEYLDFGFQKELEFAHSLIANIGGKVIHSTLDEDRYDHIDLWWIYNRKRISFDVKSMKKSSRIDANFNSTIHWIELKNVNGQLGWLFGKAHYIVFETTHNWLIIRRTDLINLLRQHIKNFTISSSKNLYTCYQRYNRQDVIVQVPITDLYSIARKILNKL